MGIKLYSNQDALDWLDQELKAIEDDPEGYEPVGFLQERSDG